MDPRHFHIKDEFFKTCRKQGMTLAKSGPLLSQDKTVYFASATITPLKDIMASGRIPKNNLYIHQQCFRLQALDNPFYNGADIQYPGYFNMLGTLVHPKNINSFQDTMIQIIEDQGISKENVKIAASSKDEILVSRLRDYYTIEYDTRDEKHYNWTYGMGPDISGRGMTFLIKLSDGSYKRIGQYIAISNKEQLIAAEYGVGIEVLLARKENYKNEYDAFSIAPVLSRNNFETNFTNTHVFSSVASAYSTGITMSHYPHKNYKKIINKMITNLLLLKTKDNLINEQIKNILQEFLLIEFGTDKSLTDLMLDFKIKESELKKQINQADAFIKNQSKLGKNSAFINQRLADLYPLYSHYVNIMTKLR